MSKNTFLLISFALLLNWFNLYSQVYHSYIIEYSGSKPELRNKLSQFDINVEKSLNITVGSKDKNIYLTARQSEIIDKLDHYFTVSINSQGDIEKISNFMKNDNKYIRIFPNYIYSINQQPQKPNDSLFSKQWYLQAINAIKGWQKATGKGVIVGIIDTGIDFTHPDLEPNLWINNGEDLNKNGKFDPWQFTELRNGIYGDLNGIDDDGNGVVDDIIGYDFVDQTIVNIGDYSNPDPLPEDQGDHGTLVSGVIAAIRNNKIGIAGIAPDAKILTAKAFDITGNAESDDIARAIIYAVMNGAKVLNFSFGERNESPIVYDAIKFAYSMGCVMVSSSGNNGWNYSHYPSDHPEVISVGGIDETLQRSGKTNYGSMLDVTAPAVNILTTNNGGSYKSTAGTSLSAPMVSALAAMMLELKPDLKPAEIRGTIQSNALRILDGYWSKDLGAGIIDIGNTLESVGTSEFEITSPQHEQTINLDQEKIIQIYGTVATSLFDSYDITVGKGIMPDNWMLITSKISSQIIDSKLGEFDLTGFDDGVYTISLRVYQKNNNIIERRIYINLTSERSKLKLISLKTENAYYNDNRVVMIAAVTDKKCNIILRYSKIGSESDFVTRQLDFKSEYHTIIVGEEIESNTEYSATAIFYTNQSDSIFSNFKFIRKNDVFQTTNLFRKSYSIPRSYLLNEVEDLYKNGKNHLVVNDLTSLYIGDTHIYEFNNNTFNLKDTSAEGWIPAGIGDSNGDGILEIFGTSDGISTLKQAITEGENPFGKELFRSTLDSTFWAEKIFDIDEDGIDELIGFKYDSQFKNYYTIYKLISGKYQLLTRAILPENFRDISIARNSLIDDFDGDGKFELIFANTRGHLFIFEFSDNKLNLEYVDSSNVASSVQFLESPDIDGDGKPEIMQTYAGSNNLFDKNEVGTPIWTVRIIRSTALDQYSANLWSENIYGVRLGSTRQGVFYRNGSSKGDLNGDGKDEIILSIFPNLYVWTYDITMGGMVPFWFYPTTFSNSAVVYDFDKNGVNELGISTFTNTSFFEYDKDFIAPSVPKNFDGWAESPTSAFFRWDLHSDAKEYLIFTVDRSKNPPQALEQARTSGSDIVIYNLTPNTNYEFVIASFNDNFKNNLSDFSEIINIYTYPIIKAERISNITGTNLSVHFSGLLKNNYIIPEKFAILDFNSDKVADVRSAILSSDSSVIITFSNELINGSYKLKTYSFRDYYSNYTIENELPFVVDVIPEKEELYLKSLELISETLLRIQFSEEVEINSAQNDDNYTMAPFGQVLYAEVDQTNNNYVLINLSQEIRKDGPRGKNYTITARNIKAISGNEITKGPGNTLGFVLSENGLRNIYVYPNPIKISKQPEIYFANLTPRADVTIMTTDGVEILRLIETDGNGGVEWDGRDKNGNFLPVGIYLFRVTGKNKAGESVFEETSKFAIIP